MTKQTVTSKELHRFLRGELSGEREASVRKALEASDALQAESRLLKALPDAFRAAEPDEADWLRMERNLLRAWRTEADRPSENMRSFASDRWWPKLAAVGVAAFVIVFIAVFLLRSSSSDPSLTSPVHSPKGKGSFAVTVSPDWAFDVGRPSKTGLSARLEILNEQGGNYIGVRSLKRGRVQGEDELATLEDGILRIRFDDRAEITLLENTALRFHEYENRVIPYLLRGSIACDVSHDETRPLVIAAARLRVKDTGTRFLVRVEETGAGRVEVTEGSVLVERPAKQELSVKAGNGAVWKSFKADAEAEPPHGAERAFQRIERLFKTLPPPIRETPPPLPKAPQKTEDPPMEPAEEPEIVTESLQEPETEPDPGIVSYHRERTSWQWTMQNLPDLQRDAIVKFYALVEKQMGSGYTLRALANLENFLEQHPGAEGEKARFLAAESHYNLQEYPQAVEHYRRYAEDFPKGTWIEMVLFRLQELRERRLR